MIINIRGTSGSGKSTIVREFLDRFEDKISFPEKSFMETPGKIFGYYCTAKSVDIPICVLGSYEKPTGGCDNISPLSKVFDNVLNEYNCTNHVIFEGLLVSRSKGRMIDLWNSIDQQDLHIIHLTTPLEECLEGIKARRLAKGNTKPVDPFRTEETFKRVAKITKDLENLGIPTYYLSREQALPKIKELLGIV